MVWDIVLGIPDGAPNNITQKPNANYAFLLHDALYQFLDAGVLLLAREQADRIFLDLLTCDGFGPRKLYFAAARIFGGLFRLYTRRKRSYRGKKGPLLTVRTGRGQF